MIKKFKWNVLLKLIVKINLIGFILTFILVGAFRFIPFYYTPFIFSKSLFHPISKIWVPLSQIHKSMQRAVIKAEDAKFYNHYGFDFKAIDKAIKYNKKHKKQKGASTISQQTAKNAFLWPARSFLRKGLEVYFTVLIEALWPKERILEVYLNLIELGPDLYGVEAASLKYFHKSAKNLTPAQSALMAAVLPNPIKFKVGHPSAYILRRQQKIIGRRIFIPKLPIPKEETKDLNEEESKEFFDLKFDSENESSSLNKESTNI